MSLASSTKNSVVNIPWVFAVVMIGAIFWMTQTHLPKRLPHDVQWWEGRVLKNFLWHDGNQEILTEDGRHLVVDWPILLEQA